MTILNHIRNLPIRRKLILMIVLTCSAVLVLALGALFVIQSSTIKSGLVRDVTNLGQIIAHNCAAAAAFNDREAAQETLSGITSSPDIEGVCLVLANGEHVTGADRMGEHDEREEEALVEGYRFAGSDALFAAPVMLDGKRVGTLHLRVDFRPIHTRLLTLYGKTLAAVLLVSLLVAFALASRFQRFIAGPILHLAGVVQSVGEKADYSLRATKAGTDEVGMLTDAFNEMLSQIQHRDTALHTAQSKLEDRVGERTQQLASSLSLLNATLEAATDGVLSIDLQGRVTNWNGRFAEIWGIPADMLERRDNEEMIAFAAQQVSDSGEYLNAVRLYQTSPQLESFDVLELKDGRVFERYIRPQSVGHECTGTVISFRDITARKQAEQNMARLNRQLVDVSRHAGMAEVASSVLHNVGNVLNSVNISLGVASD